MIIKTIPVDHQEHLELTRNAVQITKTADELRSVQALLLPLGWYLSLEQTTTSGYSIDRQKKRGGSAGDIRQYQHWRGMDGSAVCR